MVLFSSFWAFNNHNFMEIWMSAITFHKMLESMFTEPLSHQLGLPTCIKFCLHELHSNVSVADFGWLGNHAKLLM
jgi:hypothetical protein